MAAQRTALSMLETRVEPRLLRAAPYLFAPVFFFQLYVYAAWGSLLSAPLVLFLVAHLVLRYLTKKRGKAIFLWRLYVANEIILLTLTATMLVLLALSNVRLH